MKTLDDFLNFCRNCIRSRQGFLEDALADKIRITSYEGDPPIGADITDDYIDRFQTEIKTFEQLISDLKSATEEN